MTDSEIGYNMTLPYHSFCVAAVEKYLRYTTAPTFFFVSSCEQIFDGTTRTLTCISQKKKKKNGGLGRQTRIGWNVVLVLQHDDCELS